MFRFHLPKANITQEVRITSKDTSRSAQAEHIVQNRSFCPVDKRSVLVGGVGGIRTLGTLLTYTRFPVVLVMTASIPLHVHLSAAVAPPLLLDRGRVIKLDHYIPSVLFCQLLFFIFGSFCKAQVSVPQPLLSYRTKQPAVSRSLRSVISNGVRNPSPSWGERILRLRCAPLRMTGWEA